MFGRLRCHGFLNRLAFWFMQAGLKSLEAGGTMDAARSEVEVMLRNLRSSGDRGATIFGDLNAAIAEVTSSDKDDFL